MMSAVLSWGVTPFSGSFRLESGPTDRVVRLGMAAAKILVSHIQMATFLDSDSLFAGRAVASQHMQHHDERTHDEAYRTSLKV